MVSLARSNLWSARAVVAARAWLSASIPLGVGELGGGFRFGRCLLACSDRWCQCIQKGLRQRAVFDVTQSSALRRRQSAWRFALLGQDCATGEVGATPPGFRDSKPGPTTWLERLSFLPTSPRSRYGRRRRRP